MGLTALDIVVILLVGAGALFGWLRGFVCEVLSLLAWFLAIVASHPPNASGSRSDRAYASSYRLLIGSPPGTGKVAVAVKPRKPSCRM